jgi:hypothetical protein
MRSRINNIATQSMQENAQDMLMLRYSDKSAG